MIALLLLAVNADGSVE